MSLRNTFVKTLGIGALATAIVFGAKHEGLKLGTYFDPPGIATNCYGHTGPDVKVGQVKTIDECENLLVQDMTKALAVVDREAKVPLSDNTRAALASFVYNVGPGNFRQSTLLKKLNRGDIGGACYALTDWVCSRVPAGKGVTNPQAKCYTKDGHLKPLPGLIVRREEEKNLCLK